MKSILNNMKKINIFNQITKIIMIKKINKKIYKKETVEVLQKTNQKEYNTDYKEKKDRVS